ncbi:MAG: GNAT family N-acetyltransferase [Oscillospiraceae bacterium]|nr:GNAT family N-acetyltransferase [Oscillospiraceae bacterium]
MNNRIVDPEITLIPYYPNSDVTLAWYQDPDVCRQVDNIDHPYSLELLNGMYTFLSTHGECYYIRYRGKLVGDVSLQDNTEISIVICKEYQNRHIGRRCIAEILALAKEKGMREVRAKIYSFNTQSQRMFEAAGFRKTADEWYSFRFDAEG